jgi:hypothetical protein
MKLHLNIPEIANISSEIHGLSQVLLKDMSRMIEMSTVLFLIFYTLLIYFVLKLISDSIYLIIVYQIKLSN